MTYFVCPQKICYNNPSQRMSIYYSNLKKTGRYCLSYGNKSQHFLTRCTRSSMLWKEKIINPINDLNKTYF